MILNPEVLALLLINTLFTIFALIAFVLSVRIILYYKAGESTSLQYKLQKEGYLASTIIKFIFMLKIPLFLFFVFTLDGLSDLITGAMCAAGVVDATVYGNYLFVLKILNLYLFAFWLMLHHRESKREVPRYTKEKYTSFLFLFILFMIEVALEFLMFDAIELDKMVDCCGTLYSSASASYISTLFHINTPLLLGLFYSNGALLLLFYFLKNRYFFALLSVLFFVIALLSLIAFFGTYIYEMPTHHCPFCFLQKEYYYVGYLLYALLFSSTFYGVAAAFSKDTKGMQYSLVYAYMYIVIVSAYVLGYYLKTGVWL
jgi:hypothetical protein